MQNQIKLMIHEKYRSEAECARKIGWRRQRLNKITNGLSEPSVYELNEIAKALDTSVNHLVPIFLAMKSPNEQQSERR